MLSSRNELDKKRIELKTLEKYISAEIKALQEDLKEVRGELRRLYED